MKTGILEIKFKEDIKQEDMEGLLSEFYIQNESFISGMEWKQFDDHDTLKECHIAIEKRITELDKADTIRGKFQD